MDRAPAAWLLVVSAGLASTSCTALTSLDREQCLTDADCAARGADFEGTVCIENTCREAPPPEDPVWGCIGHVAAPTTAPFTSKIMVADVVTQMPVSDASVKLCSKLDTLCATPIQTPKLAADGTTSVTIPSNAIDYYLVESPSYLTTLYFIDPGGPADTARVSLLTPEVQAALNGSIGVTADPATGAINIGVTDCMHARAKGVHFDLSPKGDSIAYYSISSAVSRTATSTDIVGNGGFINVKPGVVTLTATLESTGEVIGTATTLVVANATTIQPMRPTILP